MMLTKFGRWLPVLLLLSMAGNVFLGGMTLTNTQLKTGADPVRVLDRVAASLPEADAAIVRKAMDGHGQALVAERDRRRAFRLEVAKILRAEPFDKTALTRVIDENERQEQAFRERMRGGFLNAADAISAEARRQIADIEESGVSRGR